jgi:hypothetical protein
MKKLIFVVFAVFLFFAFSFAQEFKSDSKGLTYDVKDSTSQPPHVQKTELFLMKEWLKDLKPEIRHKFLGELFIRNGHVAS